MPPSLKTSVTTTKRSAIVRKRRPVQQEGEALPEARPDLGKGGNGQTESQGNDRESRGRHDDEEPHPEYRHALRPRQWLLSVCQNATDRGQRGQDSTVVRDHPGQRDTASRGSQLSRRERQANPRHQDQWQQPHQGALRHRSPPRDHAQRDGNEQQCGDLASLHHCGGGPQPEVACGDSEHQAAHDARRHQETGRNCGESSPP